MKLIIYSLLGLMLLLSMTTAEAGGTKLFADVAPIFPLEVFGASTGIGFKAGMEFPLGPKFAGRLAFGYHKFGAKTTEAASTSYTYESKLAFIPFLAGMSYTFGQGKTNFQIAGYGGIYAPAGDLETGGIGFCPEMGFVKHMSSGKTALTLHLGCNLVFDAQTKEIVVNSSPYGGRTTVQTSYGMISYVTLSLGVQFNL